MSIKTGLFTVQLTQRQSIIHYACACLINEPNGLIALIWKLSTITNHKSPANEIKAAKKLRETRKKMCKISKKQINTRRSKITMLRVQEHLLYHDQSGYIDTQITVEYCVCTMGLFASSLMLCQYIIVLHVWVMNLNVFYGK